VAGPRICRERSAGAGEAGVIAAMLISAGMTATPTLALPSYPLPADRDQAWNWQERRLSAANWTCGLRMPTKSACWSFSDRK
jgi:hypothetical protein